MPMASASESVCTAVAVSTSKSSASEGDPPSPLPKQQEQAILEQAEQGQIENVENEGRVALIENNEFHGIDQYRFSIVKGFVRLLTLVIYIYMLCLSYIRVHAVFSHVVCQLYKRCTIADPKPLFFEWFEFCLVVMVQGVIPATSICAVFLTSLVLYWAPQIANPQWNTGLLRVSTPHYLNFIVMCYLAFNSMCTSISRLDKITHSEAEMQRYQIRLWSNYYEETMIFLFHFYSCFHLLIACFLSRAEVSIAIERNKCRVARLRRRREDRDNPED
ncbi:hypothetical protein WR25_14922 [Diploscapter pachys]|uniref:Uncharacterized protein n=1 Tax=Diploscapter pachys TaxID=2018661 RepID=A0A2A2LJF9_9BILA|nr:hypothetical protein WR25_14922 [Diploscapter pachys]